MREKQSQSRHCELKRRCYASKATNMRMLSGSELAGRLSKQGFVIDELGHIDLDHGFWRSPLTSLAVEMPTSLHELTAFSCHAVDWLRGTEGVILCVDSGSLLTHRARVICADLLGLRGIDLPFDPGSAFVIEDKNEQTLSAANKARVSQLIVVLLHAGANAYFVADDDDPGFARHLCVHDTFLYFVGQSSELPAAEAIRQRALRGLTRLPEWALEW